MERLPMCRLCLAEDVRMFIVANKNLHKLYEKLTDIPFLTKDTRPILACFFCCSKLKQCYRLMRQCLEAEELFAQKINENYEPNPLINQDRLQLSRRFIKSPIVHISLNDEFQTESFAVKEELPAVFEPKKEYQNDELELENVDYSCLDVADIPPNHTESDLEDYEPLMELQQRRGRYMKRATVAKKPKPDTPRTQLEDARTAEQTKKQKANSKGIRTTQNRTSKPDTYFKEPYKCDQRNLNQVKKKKRTRIRTGEKPYNCDVCERSFGQKNDLTKHIRVHTGERPYKCDICHFSFSQKIHLIVHIRRHTGEKPFKCNVCQRSFSVKTVLINHIRTHTGEKPFKCNICQRSFAVKGTLASHLYTHC